MPATLHARELTFSYGPRLVLDGVEVLAAPGMRIGVLGPNGAGKSTLLGLLSGRLLAERGTGVRTPPTATVGELRQDPELRPGESVAAFLARRTGVADADAALDA